MRMPRPSRAVTRNPLGTTLAVLLALAASACDTGTGPGADPPPPIDSLPRNLSVAEVGVLSASNAFGFDLLQLVRADRPGENVFLSPLSASMALGMTANGAAGETLSGMHEALRFGGLPEQEINRAYRELIDLLLGLDPLVDFHIANSIWYRHGWEPEAPFLEANRTYFDAVVEGLDFSLPGAAVTINDWVAEATSGRITEIVEPPIDPLTVLYLINAIDFDGTWTHSFDPADTRSAPFRNLDGTEGEVRLMTRKAVFGYAHTPDAQVVELPYGGQAYAMTVVLPREDRSVDELVAGLDADGWNALVEGLHEQEVTVGLPRFRMEWERTLNDDLEALGMARALTPHLADFTRMFEHALDHEVHIQEVKQKSYVEVDEVGTRAAAVTSVGIGITSAPPSVTVDRPFLFAIRERLSGTVLFMGVVVEAPGW